MQFKCPKCREILIIESTKENNAFIGKCNNVECKKSWFLEKNPKNNEVRFVPAKEYIEDPLGKRVQRMLGLNHIPIVFIKSENVSNIYYNKQIKKFVIDYKDEMNLIHELGHIIFNNNPKHYEIENPREVQEPHPIELIMNAIIDIFVDFNLSYNLEIPKYHDNHLEQQSKSVKKILSAINNNKSLNLNIGLGHYIHIFLTVNIYLKEEEKKTYSKKWNICLKRLKRRLIYGLNLSEEKFKDLEKKLMKIPELIDKPDLRNIAEFILNSLLILGLWTKSDLYYKLKDVFL